MLLGTCYMLLALSRASSITIRFGPLSRKPNPLLDLLLLNLRHSHWGRQTASLISWTNQSRILRASSFLVVSPSSLCYCSFVFFFVYLLIVWLLVYTALTVEICLFLTCKLMEYLQLHFCS